MVAEGKPIPTELRKEEAQLRHQVSLEDDNTAVPRTHIDDEYARAADRDPRPLITTSRDPSSRLVQFAKELKLVFPNSVRINRGGNVRGPGFGGGSREAQPEALPWPFACCATPPLPNPPLLPFACCR